MVFIQLKTEPVVYQANKVATAAELGCNGSMLGRGSGDGNFESCKHNFFFGVKNIKLIVANIIRNVISKNLLSLFDSDWLGVRLPIACWNTFSGARASFCWASRSSDLLPGSCASLHGSNLTSAVGYWTRKQRSVAARSLNWSPLERVAGERAKSVVEAP